MDWQLLWAASSAIATFLAVIVALWQSSLGQKRKLEVRITENIIAMRTDLNKGIKGISIDIFNLGNRTIEVKTLYFYIKKQKKTGLVVVSPGVTDEIVIELPCKLEPDDSLTISLSNSWCCRTFTERLERMHSSHLSANDKISFFVRDSRGKSYRAKGKSTYAEFLTRCSNQKKEW